MRTATIWRECAHCGTKFGQPDDPGRKRRYCTDACKQAAYRARKRAEHHARQEQARGAHEEDARRQREDARRYRQYQEYQRQERAREEARRREQRQRTYQPPPGSSNGHRTYTAAHARARRIIEALLCKAASTNYPHEAAACRAKAEELRRKHGL